MSDTAPAAPSRLARRLVPLQVAVGLSGMVLWVPVEKLFMTQIGFTPGTVAIMAAAYAAVVPLLEVPSGILADRWSRSRLMVCASVALLLSTVLGGLSRNVPTYIAAAMILGVYFALSSGTVDSIVYDAVMEETGSSDEYETWIGRVNMVESGSLVISALGGGLIAGWTSARVTYFATLPFVAASAVAFLRFTEPRLHRAAEPVPLRSQVAVTYRTMIRMPKVRQVMLLSALTAMLAQAVFEFGPLWLVALAAPAALFGPYWAAVVSTLGIGGYLTGKLNMSSRAVVAALALATPAVTLALTLTRSLAAVIVAQTLLSLLLAIISIRAGKLLHDGVPATIRAGVSSGAGTLSWLLFLPFSLVFGWFAHAHGVRPAGWFLTGAALVAAWLLVGSARRDAEGDPASVITMPAVIPRPADRSAVGCRELR
ncbi:MFS transporter [Pseudofrankia inefficax]|uniref:Major facilitator superfamily MFS_1 n=1 Tax=Pseudofrankia inefficax (strain DSM 45817 / CECT 9037 / DDB 130130 / EuI1c) TaxID=298654 RepID=E3J9U1_PSEI1|nr:MFS transporter [Pseudofrankia inefficax]ADP84594.1 major facilitator superfamily MFS_1 [Pseudofrankia inefficax]